MIYGKKLMSILQDVIQKINSVHYKIKASRFKKSPSWINSPHNISVPRVDWDEHDLLIQEKCAQSEIEYKLFHIDRTEFETFKEQFNLPFLSLYALRCKEKKMMEHFISYKLLDIQKDEIYFVSSDSM